LEAVVTGDVATARPSAPTHHTRPDLTRRRLETQVNIGRLVRRIVLYLIIPPVAQGGVVAVEVYYHFTNADNFPLEVWSTCGSSSVGVLNLLAFFCDPAFHSAVRAWWRATFKSEQEWNGQRDSWPVTDADVSQLSSAIKSTEEDPPEDHITMPTLEKHPHVDPYGILDVDLLGFIGNGTLTRL